MKKFLVLMLVCVLVVCGCDFITGTDTTAATTTTTAATTAVVTSATTTAVTVKDPSNGLTDNEIEYLMDLLKSKNVPCVGIDDIVDMRCCGRYSSKLVYPSMVWETDYTNIEYGVLVKRGPAVNLCIPVELLEEWGIDISERIK